MGGVFREMGKARLKAEPGLPRGYDLQSVLDLAVAKFPGPNHPPFLLHGKFLPPARYRVSVPTLSRSCSNAAAVTPAAIHPSWQADPRSSLPPAVGK